MKSLLRYPGSKWNLAKRIANLLPEHKSYLEPFFGSGAVLFTKSASPIETVNDLSDDVVNLFRLIQSEPKALQEKLYLIPYSRTIYNQAWEVRPADEIEKAVNFIIRSTMSHGFRVFEKSGWKNDIAGREKSYAVKHKDHEELLDLLNQSRAKIILSGYDSDLYNRRLSNWNHLEFAATAEKGLPRTEVLWMNFQPTQQLELFGA